MAPPLRRIERSVSASVERIFTSGLPETLPSCASWPFTGARAEEACGVTIAEFDRRAERPIWAVGRSKSGKSRDVPLPRFTVEAIDDWLAEC